MTDEDALPDDLRQRADVRGDIDPAADAVTDHWKVLIAEMDDVAAEYRDQGWTAHTLHPGDITPLFGENVNREGLDILVPDNEFTPIEDAVEAGGTFGNATVYRNSTNGVLFFLAVLEDAPSETAILVPGYYTPDQDHAFLQYLNEEDSVELHVRPLDQRTVVTFRADDPSLFQPDN